MLICTSLRFGSQVLARVRKLIVATPPNGPERLKSLDEVIARELNWSTWKRLGCTTLRFIFAPLEDECD